MIEKPGNPINLDNIPVAVVQQVHTGALMPRLLPTEPTAINKGNSPGHQLHPQLPVHWVWPVWIAVPVDIKIG